jgi:ATP phosphoribosyltransferase regulatory subunit
MLEMLAMSGLQNVHLDLGHVGIYRALSKQAELTDAQEAELFDVLQRKARPELQELMAGYSIAEQLKAMFLKLPELNGGQETIAQARAVLATANGEVKQALADLEGIAERLTDQFPSLPISFDLAELRGYHYHTGVVFAAFVPSVGREIARGGRYDNIGAIFGRARAATGFSADLKVLSALGKKSYQKQPQALIFAPYLIDAALNEKIRDLRAEGLAVVQQLPGQTGTAQELKCTSVLELDHQNWVVRPLASLE